MKRLIKYTSPYEDKQFSDCATKYEVLPYVVDDNADSTDLRDLAKLIGYTPIGRAETLKSNRHGLSITHTIPVSEETRLDCFGKPDSRQPIKTTRLGFIELAEGQAEKCEIEVNVECEGILTQDQASNIINYQPFGFNDFITIDNETLLNIDSWSAFHHLDLLGYSLKQFMSLYDCTSTVFSDEVTSCDHCGEYMYNDNGYTYNYRIVDGELLGLECGCYTDHIESNWSDRVNDTKTPIELEVAETLEEQGLLEHLERFIGGMVDGRGGFYAGQSTREGQPDSVLEEYRAKYPNTDFIFTHDESGQFQTYFSIWRVTNSEEKGA